MKDKFHLFEDVLSPEECARYEGIFLANSHDDVSNPRPHFKFLATPTIEDKTSNSWDPDGAFQKIVDFAKQFFLDNYEIRGKFELKRMFVHIMKQGAEIEHHIDDGDIYENKPLNEKHYSAVLVINDKYDGGEFYFSELDFCQKLSAGSLILFRGDAERQHGVKLVTSGNRISMPIFFREYE